MGVFKSPIIIICLLQISDLTCVTAADRKVLRSDVILVKDTDILKEKRDLQRLPHFLTYSLESDDVNIRLTLMKRSELSPGNFKVKFHQPEFEKMEYKSLENVGFYHEPLSQAVISVTSEGDTAPYKRTLTGTFVHNNKAFEITPISDDVDELIKSRGIGSSNSHWLHHLTEVELPSHEEYERQTSGNETNIEQSDNEDGHETEREIDELEILMKRLLKSNGRARRMTSYTQDEFDVEMIFLIDYSIYKYWLERNRGSHRRAVYDIHFFFSHIFHGIYMAYSSISYDVHRLKITPWLKEIRICTSRQDSWMIEKAKLTKSKFDVDRGEDNLRAYMEDNGLDWANPDHLMLWTRYTLVMDNKEGLLGVAGDICSVCAWGKGLSQNFEYGLFSWATGAHELAHSLGAQHDKKSYGCPASEKYLMTAFTMAPTEQNYRNAFTFSWCSIKMMMMCIKGRQYGGITPVYPRACVYNKVCQHGHPLQDELSRLPGQMYNLREQCQISLGDDKYTYDANCNSGKDICRSMKCKLYNQCTQNGNVVLRAAMGSPCGQDKICFKGECLDRDSIKYSEDQSQQSCSVTNKVPKGCYDNQQYIHDDELTCPEIAHRRPWMCFYNSDIQRNCPASCFKWGLVRVKHPLCNFVEVQTHGVPLEADTLGLETASEAGYMSKLRFRYCGYQWGRWYVSCPGDPQSCIPMQYACNGVDDCPGGVDEQRDWCFKVPSGIPGKVRCPGEPHDLIDEDQLCDGHVDCPGGRDEEKAKCDHFSYCDDGGTEVSCPNNPKQCVPVQFTCDGREDCGVDEQAGDEDPDFCITLCAPGMIRCPKMETGSDCIYGQWACDGRDDCGDNADEDPHWCEGLMKQPPITCPNAQVHCPTAPYICIYEGYLCDGISDCPDGGDEQRCTGTLSANSVTRLQRLLHGVFDDKERVQLKANMVRDRKKMKTIDRKIYEMGIQQEMYRSHLAKPLDEK